VPGVFPYLYTDGLKFEAKLPEEILSKTTIDSIKGAPVTDGHPVLNDEKILVDSVNYQQYAKGNVSEPIIENGEGTALITIYDADLIEDVKSKKKNSVSIGFICDEDPTGGLYNGVKYDSIQRNIIINHLACVEIARAGDATKIHVDGGTNMSKIKELAAGAGEGTPDEGKKEENKTFSYRKFDGSKDIAVPQEIHSELMLLRNEIKEQGNKIKADQDQLEALKSELAQIQPSIPDPEGEAQKATLLEQIETFKEQVNAWKEKYSQLEEAVPEMADAMAEEKTEVLEAAKGVDGINIDGLSTKEIKLQIISKGLPFREGIKIDSVSDEIVDARYDAAIELLRKQANINTKSNTKSKTSEIKIDKSTIEEKRANLQNQYRRGTKK